ncbi:unnamed protein product [Adineta steineri]|uniref:Intermembrane lipid transfer protein VPS13-like C-terminal domain-containing protein n=1 Tax=Adineta steineri TaxID=433720 RepID=A0A814RUC0_9BILA|nr:unnamed protein product [Adineta steineri]
MKKLPKDTPEIDMKKKAEEEEEARKQQLKVPDDNKTIGRSVSTTGKIVKKNDVPVTPTLKIEADLEEFRIIIASKITQLFDIQVQGVKADVSQAPEKTLINLILSDLRVFDPYEGARYRKIISQQGDDKELLRVDLCLFNYPDEYVKPLDIVDCDVKVQFAKANIVFLFKHIDAILNFLDSLNITKAALDLASTQADAAYEQVQKLQEQAFKVHLDITFNAPNIIIPTNSYSDEALLFDLGKLTLLTRFYDDPKRSLVEQQNMEIEVVETVSDKEQDKWGPLNPEQIIPFWPHNIKEGVMRVRYTHNRVTSSPFMMNQKHRTLLRMDDEERPAIYVEVTATDFDGVRVIFGDYKIGDAPLLLVNCLKKDPISFCQVDDVRAQVLPPLNYVYYTWSDPLKPRELVISCGSKKKTVELTPQCGFLGQDGDHNVSYTTFVDGVQTVLLFSDDTKVIEAASGMPSLAESMGQRVQIGIHDIGLSIVNDVTREEMLYIISSHYQNQFMKQLHVLVLGLDVLGNPFGVIRGLAEGVESFFYEPYRGAIEGPVEFAEGVTTGVRTLVGSAVGGAAGAFSKITGVLGKGLATLTFDEDYKISRIRRKEPTTHRTTDIAIGGRNVVMGFVNGVTGVVTKPVSGAKEGGASGFVKGLGKGFIGFVTKPTGGIVDFASTSLDLIKRTAQQEEVVRRVRYPRHVGRDGLVRPYISHEAMGFFILNKLEDGKYAKIDTYVAHITCSDNPPSWLLATSNLGFYERTHDRYTITKLSNEVSSHYQNQFMKQLHVLVLGLDVLGNPFGVIRGLAEGVESFFYEPYKGAIEGPMEFAEGVATGVRTLVGSAVGGAAGAFSKITGVLGKGLATLTFDEDYKISRIRRKEPATHATTDIAVGGKNVVMGFVDGVTGVVTKPVSGAKEGGASGFVKGLGKGFIGLVTRPTGGIVDFASTSLDLIKRTAQQEEVVRRVRYPRHVGRDGLVRPYISHEAMGFFILNKLEDGKYAKIDTYVAHITCSDNPPSWLLATSKRLLFITEISFLGLYEIDWRIEYEDLKEEPVVKPNLNQIQILTKESKKTGTLRSTRSFGKMVKYRNISEARYIVDKITNAMHTVGL